MSSCRMCLLWHTLSPSSTIYWFHEISSVDVYRHKKNILWLNIQLFSLFWSDIIFNCSFFSLSLSETVWECVCVSVGVCSEVAAVAYSASAWACGSEGEAWPPVSAPPPEDSLSPPNVELASAQQLAGRLRAWTCTARLIIPAVLSPQHQQPLTAIQSRWGHGGVTADRHTRRAETGVCASARAGSHRCKTIRCGWNLFLTSTCFVPF